MFVGVIADTHDRLPMIDRALELFAGRKVEAVIHPGDLIAPFAARCMLGYKGPLHVTYGNNDRERAGLKETLPDYQNNRGPGSVNWLSDAELEFGVSRCPADCGYTGLRVAWRNRSSAFSS